MKFIIGIIILLSFISSIFSLYIPNEIIKRQENNSTSTIKTISKTSASATTIIPTTTGKVGATETSSTLISTSTTSFNNTHTANDAFFKICTFIGGEEQCEEIYEDEINGGSSCTEAIHNECPLNMNYDEENVNTYCSSYFNQEKCSKLYSEGFQSLPACKDKNPRYLEVLYENNVNKYSHTKLICTMDNEGKVCPYTSYNYLRKYGQVDNDTFWYFMKESCKSQACMDVIPIVFETESQQYTADELKLFREAIEYFKTNECLVKTSSTIINYKCNFSNILISLFSILLLSSLL